MQHLENDMDDLFNKAGNDYPLNTSGANWDVVKKGLTEEESTLPLKKSNNYKRYSWLLLLMLVPLVWMHSNRSNTLSGPSSSNVKSSTATTQPNSAEPSARAGTEGRNNAGQSPAIADARQPATSGTNEPGPINKSSPVAVDEPATKQSSRFSGPDAKGTASSNRIGVASPDRNPVNKKITGRGIDINAQQTTTQLSKRRPPSPHDAKRVASNEDATDAVADTKGNEHAKGNATINEKANDETIKNDSPGVQSKNQAEKNNIPDAKKADTLANPKTENAVSSIDKKKLSKQKKPKVYVGLIVGPDISWIGSQEVNNVGYSVGLGIGYRLNKHFSVELGALYDQKKYYTDGKHFDKSGTNIPATVTIADMYGGCNMFEFPLSVRYDFNIRKSSFFIASGLTSYLMKKESYHYSAEAGNTWYNGFRSYKNSGNHLFSNLQFSAGYNQRLSSSTRLRIEPYIKIPVKNIGIGKMPVTSSGLYLGIVHDLK